MHYVFFHMDIGQNIQSKKLTLIELGFKAYQPLLIIQCLMIFTYTHTHSHTYIYIHIYIYIYICLWSFRVYYYFVSIVVAFILKFGRISSSSCERHLGILVLDSKLILLGLGCFILIWSTLSICNFCFILLFFYWCVFGKNFWGRNDF